MCIVAPPPTVRTLVDQGAPLLSLSPPLRVVTLGGITLGAMLLSVGCFTGLPDGGPEPWETHGDGGSEGVGDDGADSEDDGENGSLDGGATDPSAGDGVTSAPGDADGGDADGGDADGGSVDSGGVDSGGVDSSGVEDGGVEEGGGEDGGEAEVPDNAFCDDVAGWQPGWSDLEEQILDIVNQRRAEGANCGTAGSFGPTGPLTMNPALRCAARVHSKQMVEQNFFAHDTPWGETPWQRIGAAGYQYSTAGENIAAGNATAVATMQQWMDSDGHCGNIMKPDFDEIGIGYYPGGGYGHYWTQNFGAQ